MSRLQVSSARQPDFAHAYLISGSPVTGGENVTTQPQQAFVLGVDLDGVVADFYDYMRTVTAEWRGVSVDQLPEEVSYGLPEWGLVQGEYERLHRFAVTQRHLFDAMAPIPGAPQALRRLSAEGVRIRIITYRLFIPYFHQTAVRQSIKWLENHAIPYWDLCFMKEKGDVGADLYVEDSPTNIDSLRAANKKVIIYSNSTNRDRPDEPGGRANHWGEAEEMIRKWHYEWRRLRGLAIPEGPGLPPPEA
jgi:beta-phosphoglucomutase-like phosphatase (HAD superfamily)